jgi:hypothetical protein
MDDDLPAMWYCPNCRTWNGRKLGRCLGCDHDRPRLPVTTEDVPVQNSTDVTLTHRVRAKVRKLP